MHGQKFHWPFSGLEGHNEGQCLDILLDKTVNTQSFKNLNIGFFDEWSIDVKHVVTFLK